MGCHLTSDIGRRAGPLAHTTYLRRSVRAANQGLQIASLALQAAPSQLAGWGILYLTVARVRQARHGAAEKAQSLSLSLLPGGFQLSSATSLRLNPLGSTGLEVSQLAMGVLPIGPAQLNVPLAEGQKVVAAALDGGVNFVDTAQSYGTYDYIRPALVGRADRIVVASKSAAASYGEMKAAIDEALRALGVERLGIFHLHAARVTPEVFEQRAGAIKCLIEAKKAGVIQATGIATHSVTVARAAADRDEIDVVFPIINVKGLGILHGSRDDMVAAIQYAASIGKGLYAMKIFGGGNLLDNMRGALEFARGIPGLAAYAVGMVSLREVEMNLRIFSGREEAPAPGSSTFQQKKLTVLSFCQGCGTCVETCPNYALTLVDGKAVLDRSKCLLCGYCAPVCPQFAIRMV